MADGWEDIGGGWEEISSARKSPKQMREFSPADQDRIEALSKKSKGDNVFSRVLGVSNLTPKESDEYWDLIQRRGSERSPVSKLMKDVFVRPDASEIVRKQRTKEESAPYESGARVAEMTGSPALGAATYAGIEAIPSLIGGWGGGALGGKILSAETKPMMDWLKNELMFSSLKPSSAGTASLAKQLERVQTMFKGPYNVSAKGIEKMHGRISDLEGEIKGLLKSSPEKTTLADISAEASGARSKFVLENDQKTVDRIFNELQKKHFGSDMPVEQAHELKQLIYKNVKEKGFSGELPSAEKEAMKGVARGIRGSEMRVPGVSEKLAEQSKLIDVLEPAEKRAIVELRNNPIGIAMLAHNPKLMALYIGDRSSAFKSALANLINQRGPAMAQSTGRFLGATPGAISLYDLTNARP